MSSSALQSPLWCWWRMTQRTQTRGTSQSCRTPVSRGQVRTHAHLCLLIVRYQHQTHLQSLWNADRFFRMNSTGNHKNRYSVKSKIKNFQDVVFFFFFTFYGLILSLLHPTIYNLKRCRKQQPSNNPCRIKSATWTVVSVPAKVSHPV